MAAEILHGRRSWSVSRDEYGFRTYMLKTVVSCDPLDGPSVVLACPGLPRPGDNWSFGNDLDIWCWCHRTAKATMLNEGEPNTLWEVEQEFSNHIVNFCTDAAIENPLLYPQKISGSFCKYTEEASYDRRGLPIVNSCWQTIRGPQVEFDVNRATVKIEQNVPVLELALINQLANTVNDAPLWGVPARCVKLSNITWSRQFYGQCNAYFTRAFEFDICMRLDPVTLQVVSGFDRDAVDEGTKVLFGHWDSVSGDYILDKIVGVFQPNPLNPAHFAAYRDRTGALGSVVLNGAGLPAGVQVRAGTSLYISITVGHVPYDTGDTSHWIKLATNPANRPLWSAGTTYPFGALVNYRTPLGAIEIYVCDDPAGTSNTPSGPFGWFKITSVTDRGAYDSSVTNYLVGDYAAVPGDVGPYHFSIVPAPQHTALDITNTAKWLKLVTSPTVIPPWRAGTYPQGSLVILPAEPGYPPGIYVCVAAAGSALKPALPDWLLVPAVVNQGTYNGTANYSFGDYVSPPISNIGGRIHIEKYQAANFLLLGIPTVLG